MAVVDSNCNPSPSGKPRWLFIEDEPEVFYDVHSIEVTKYQDGNMAAIAHCIDNGGVLEEVRISVNLAHGQKLESKDLDKCQFFFNVGDLLRGLFVALFNSGWLAQEPDRVGTSGFNTYPIVRLTDEAVIRQLNNCENCSKEQELRKLPYGSSGANALLCFRCFHSSDFDEMRADRKWAELELYSTS